MATTNNVMMADTGGLKNTKQPTTVVSTAANAVQNTTSAPKTNTSTTPKTSTVASAANAVNTATAPAGGVKTTVTSADGTVKTAYIVNGKTVNADGSAYQFKNGDQVKTQGGTYTVTNGVGTKTDTTPKSTSVVSTAAQAVQTAPSTPATTQPSNKSSDKSSNKSSNKSSDGTVTTPTQSSNSTGIKPSAAADLLVNSIKSGNVTDISDALQHYMNGEITQADYDYIVGKYPQLKEYLTKLEYAGMEGRYAFTNPSSPSNVSNAGNQVNAALKGAETPSQPPATDPPVQPKTSDGAGNGNGQSSVQNATPTVVIRNGKEIPAYLLNGHTVDANGNPFSFQNGDAVNTAAGQYVYKDGKATLNTGAPITKTPGSIGEASDAYSKSLETDTVDNTPVTASGKTIAQMLKESGGVLTPEIVKADPHLYSNEDGTMVYITAIQDPNKRWVPIEQLSVPTYINGGYWVDADTSEIKEDKGPVYYTYGDGSRGDDKSYAYTPPKGGKPTTVVRNGKEIPAYIVDGKTVDVNGAPFQFQNGDAVNTLGGQYIWNNGKGELNTGELITGTPYEGSLATTALMPPESEPKQPVIPDTVPESLRGLLMDFLTNPQNQSNANQGFPAYPDMTPSAGTATATGDYSGMSDAQLQQFILDAINSGDQAAIRDYMTWAEAQAIARERMNPMYDKFIQQQLDDLDVRALRSGFYGQLPTEALRQQALASTEGDRTQAIIDYAQQLLDADRSGVLKEAELNRDAYENRINTLFKLLESNRSKVSDDKDRELKKYIADQDNFNTQGKLRNDMQQSNNELAYKIWSTIYNAGQDATSQANDLNYKRWLAEFNAGNEKAQQQTELDFKKWLAEFDADNEMTQQQKDLAYKYWVATLK